MILLIVRDDKCGWTLDKCLINYKEAPALRRLRQEGDKFEVSLKYEINMKLV